MKTQALQQHFSAALDGLVEQVKTDPSVLAAILCGSLSHDAVWAKSDIDLVLITIDDAKSDLAHVALAADGVNVHAMLMQRSCFRKTVEGSIHHSFMHSFLAKGRLLYTHDPSIADLCGRLQGIGSRDAALQLLSAATSALPLIDKAHKFFLTRGDLDYTALWLLYSATALARIEVISAGALLDREVLPQAMRLNPSFFKTVYTDLLNEPKTKGRVVAALDAVDEYIASRASRLFELVVDHLRDVGEPRSATEIENHFKKQFDIEGVTTACEYLADRDVIGKTSTRVRLTRRSRVDVQELAFFYLDDAGDAR
jgi:hypothetical protein